MRTGISPVQPSSDFIRVFRCREKAVITRVETGGSARRKTLSARAYSTLKGPKTTTSLKIG
jgi:hypothetical protein